jgi:hypothetical protein
MLGLGPDSEFNEPDINLINKLNTMHGTKEIVTYNITFTGEHNHVRDADLSYVQIGPYNRALAANTDFIICHDSSKYWNAINSTQIKSASSTSIIPMFGGGIFKAIFDTSVDYLHVNSIYFEEFEKALKASYGNNITCTDKYCFFDSSCDSVYKQKTTIIMMLGPNVMESYKVELDLEDYLFVDKHPLEADKSVCYMPIFVLNAGEDIDAEKAWFLGNMFMNKYLVIHHNEFMWGQHTATVGFYDKT